jgi:Ca2+-binding EF-hand superfamily protein
MRICYTCLRNRFRRLILNVAAHAMPTAELASLRETFEALDTNNSGTLSMDEFTRSLQGYVGQSEVANHTTLLYYA